MEIANTGKILIVTSLFLGACALFVPYLSEILKRNLFAPKLKILFKLEPPYCRQTDYRSLVNSFKEPVYYFRFQVLNIGKTQAKLCEVVLENLWIYNAANKPQLYKNFSPVNMIWVGISDQFININPNRRVFCDIGHISSPNYQKEKEYRKFIDLPGYTGNDLRFVLELHRIFYSQPNSLAPGRYLLQFGLYSENAGYKKEFFDISWSGKWKDREEQMFREIVITNIKNPDINKK